MTIKKTVMYLTSVDTVNYSQVPDTVRDLCTVCVYNDTHRIAGEQVRVTH